jgi:hypothetical protein
VNVSRATKGVFGLAIVLVVAGYLVLIDLGLSAGRVHHGVRVDGVDIGGLTLAEAVALVEDAGEELKQQEIVPTAEGFDCRFTPEEVGWGPQPFDTVEMAMRVGRDDAPFGALADRVRAYFDDIELDWAGKPNERGVRRLLDGCEEQAAALGVVIDRRELRLEIGRAINSTGRRRFEIPLLEELGS